MGRDGEGMGGERNGERDERGEGEKDEEGSGRRGGRIERKARGRRVRGRNRYLLWDS